MFMVSLPLWFWLLYYLSLFISFLMALRMLWRKRSRKTALFVIFFVLTIPFISIFNAIGRGEEMNEGEFFLHELADGALWALYSVFGYLVLLWYWWKAIILSVKRRG
ncbi:hypothetical protein [Cytobacillus sp. FSL K6-0265]|uniref:hypothetical protein n=2 Tax=Cytobacillus TaxID=2675230 RepID=UPI001782CF29